MKPSTCAVVLAIALMPLPLSAQEPSSSQTQPAEPRITVGTVVMVRPNTLIVRTDDGRYIVFETDRSTERPKTLPAGAHVSIESTALEDTVGGGQKAVSVTLSGPQPTAQTPPPVTEDAIPPDVRRLEHQIASTVRKYRAGVRAGVALDPELVTFGAHVMLGPFFTRRLLFSPNVELAYGELTTLFAVNLEAIYRLTDTMPRNRWSPYIGGGATLGFSHKGFSTPAGTGRSFDFGDFNYNGGVTLLAGIEKPNGPFVELKSTIYTDPHFRLLFGFTF